MQKPAGRHRVRSPQRPIKKREECNAPDTRAQTQGNSQAGPPAEGNSSAVPAPRECYQINSCLRMNHVRCGAFWHVLWRSSMARALLPEGTHSDGKCLPRSARPAPFFIACAGCMQHGKRRWAMWPAPLPAPATRSGAGQRPGET